MFCPKCGSILKPKNEKGKKVLYCSCGYTDKDVKKAEIKEEVKDTSGELEVVEPEEELKSLPITETECPKCKHKKAYFWLVQTRAGDEAETKFLKCEKCKHTWRDYG